MDYNWDEIEERLSALTVKQLRKVGSLHFKGMLGGASAKTELVGEMVTQMRHWQSIGMGSRVSDVLITLAGIQ